MFSFGGTVLLAHVFWTIQSQSDIFIAGRVLSTHELGLYAEALFLTTIFTAKFVPPLNEIAFPAYSRLQKDPKALSWSFLKAVRLIMLIACPIYFGMAVTAHELIHVVLGEKWLAMAPLVAVLALVMPLMTLQILFAPANNALGRPEISARVTMFGAIVMPIAFLIGVQYGVMGLVWGWVFAFPLLTIFTFLQSHGHIGISAGGLARAVWPGLSASVVMAVAVYAVAQALPDIIVYARLLVLLVVGAAAYLALLYLLAKPTLLELIQLIVRRKPPENSDAKL